MSFIEAVAERCDRTVDEVRTVLDRANVVAQPALPQPRKLLVTRVRFAGEKHIAGRDPESFEFDQALGPGLWAITSRGNLLGKSSVLFVIRWALTGRSHLRDDVRSWIHEVVVEGQVGSDDFVVHISDQGHASGTLTVNGEERGTFVSDDGFEELVGAFFSSALGLDPTPFWQSRPGGGQGEGDPRRLGWQGYFPALHVRGSEGPLLGDQVHGGQPGSLLQVFLGLPWALTAASARVAWNAMRQQLSAARRRAEEDVLARESERQPFEEELAQVNRELQELVSTARIPPAEADRRLLAFGAAVHRAGHIRQDLQEAEQALAAAREEYEHAERRVLALRESGAVRPLLGRLQPVTCPRCQHDIDDERHAREQLGHCSVCDELLVEPEDDASELAEADEELEAVRQAVLQAEEQVASLSSELVDADTDREGARERLNEVSETEPQQERQRELELRKATLEGALGQHPAALAPSSHLEELERTVAILDCARREATERREDAAGTLLDRLAAEVTDLGQRFGVANLESVEPTLGAQMRVTTGGVSSAFSSLTAGEQLRLRLALLIGLLRIGSRDGVGRFPGLLLVDSPGSEEMVESDVAEILGELRALTEELPELELIAASARADLVTDVVPGTHLIAGPEEREVW